MGVAIVAGPGSGPADAATRCHTPWGSTLEQASGPGGAIMRRPTPRSARLRRHYGSRRNLVVTVGLVGLLSAAALGACGDNEPTGSAATAVSTASSDVTPPASNPGSDTAATPTASPATGSSGTGAGTPVADGSLPGEPFEIGYLREGDVLSVVGVAFDDKLNVRALPGAIQPIIGSLQPLEDRVVATGRLRRLPAEGTIWAEIGYGDGTGWVNVRYLAYLGQVEDLTSVVVERSGGQVPNVESMDALGQFVLDALGSDDTGEGSRMVQSAASTVGDLGEVTFDTVGAEDDAVTGLRLHVFGTPVAGGGFALKSVEATPLCLRDVDADGFCV